MNVLIACEESQRVCKAFRARGHRAFSADIQECSGGHPEWHILGDVLPLLNGNCNFMLQNRERERQDGRWDLIIAHPPCTYITNAGARWLYAGKQLNTDRYIKGLEGSIFLLKMLAADCDKVVVENPMPSSIFNLPKYTQIIQPYEFGEPYSKKTCLWIRGLEPLKPTNVLTEYKPYCSSGSYSKTHDEKYKGVSRSGGASKIRSKTFIGIAEAMAEQWG